MIGMNYSEESHSETKFAWSLARRKEVINDGWDFLGLEQDEEGDWGNKFGKPIIKPETEPTALPWADVTNHTDITKTQWKLSKDSLINDGYVFLGYDVDYAGDACFVLGKPVEAQLCYEPTIVLAWDIAPPCITVEPKPKTLYCPHCGYALVASTIPSHAYQYPSIERHTWICNNCIAEVSS